jgi:hypothetical protein
MPQARCFFNSISEKGRSRLVKPGNLIKNRFNIDRNSNIITG